MKVYAMMMLAGAVAQFVLCIVWFRGGFFVTDLAFESAMDRSCGACYEYAPPPSPTTLPSLALYLHTYCAYRWLACTHRRLNVGIPTNWALSLMVNYATKWEAKICKGSCLT